MLTVNNVQVVGIDAAIRGMRNPKNSWDRSDSHIVVTDDGCSYYEVGPNDEALMKQLAECGPVHAKYRRMIVVYVDITAPLYWWKEFDTYKVGTVANSCSTMHKVMAKEFEPADFSCDHLNNHGMACLSQLITFLNYCREKYQETKDKEWWWQVIQSLPTSYNQKRTVMLNYEVLANINKWRTNHKLDEWHTFCDWYKTLPYAYLITISEKGKKDEV